MLPVVSGVHLPMYTPITRKNLAGWFRYIGTHFCTLNTERYWQSFNPLSSTPYQPRMSGHALDRRPRELLQIEFIVLDIHRSWSLEQEPSEASSFADDVDLIFRGFSRSLFTLIVDGCLYSFKAVNTQCAISTGEKMGFRTPHWLWFPFETRRGRAPKSPRGRVHRRVDLPKSTKSTRRTVRVGRNFWPRTSLGPR